MQTEGLESEQGINEVILSKNEIPPAVIPPFNHPGQSLHPI